MGRNLVFKIILWATIVWITSANPIAPRVNDAKDESNAADYDVSADLYDETSAPDGEDVYASEFPYEEPMAKFNTDEKADKPTSRKGRAHVRIVHKWAKPKNYAKKYRTWMPAKEWIKPDGRKGAKRLGGSGVPPPRSGNQSHRRNSPQKRRRLKHHRGNYLQKPIPPPEPDYEYVSEEEYFPEETKRNEFEYHERRPPQAKLRRRKPGKINKDQRHGSNDDFGSVSYSNFVQHPRPTHSTIDYADFVEEEHSRPKMKRRKKKKRKVERKRIRDHEDDQYGAHSESSEETLVKGYSERYPPYFDDTPHQRPLRHPTPTPATPIYGDGYVGNQISSTKFPYRQNLKNRGYVDRPSLDTYRDDINPGVSQTFGNQNYKPTGFNNFGVSNNSPAPAHHDIVTQQNYQQFQNPTLNQNPQLFNNQIQVSQPNYNAINNLNEQAANNFNYPNNYHQNPVSRPSSPSQNQNAHTYENVPKTHHEFSSKYKSNSFFDNTETFHDFNQNLNLQEEKRYGAKQGRPNNFVPSREYQEPGDVENEFINRHLDLYSNGMSGVPIQGDGFGNEKRQQQFTSKDYDIGYGEIQYDESHTSQQS